MEYKQRTKEVKNLLAKIFGFQNVRVKQGSGTSRSWVYANITIPKPHTHSCTTYDCRECAKARVEAKRATHQAVKHIDFETYDSELFETQSKCFLLEIEMQN